MICLIDRAKALSYVILPFQGINTPNGGEYPSTGACPYLIGPNYKPAPNGG